MKEITLYLVDEYEINGEVVEVIAGQIVRATPCDGSGPEYIRLQFNDGRSYKWGAPLSDWNETIAEDDPRWVAE